MASREAVYGVPPPALAMAGTGALQLSPLIPQSAELETLGDASLDRVVVAAPQGTLERRYVLAHALRSLREAGELIALAPKDKGGGRLRSELESFGCAVSESARRHQRICVALRPGAPQAIDEAIALGSLQVAPQLNLWSQPGVFSWDRVDPGSALSVSYTHLTLPTKRIV